MDAPNFCFHYSFTVVSVKYFCHPLNVLISTPARSVRKYFPFSYIQH